MEASSTNDLDDVDAVDAETTSTRWPIWKVLLGVAGAFALMPVAGMVLAFAVVPALPIVLAMGAVLGPINWLNELTEDDSLDEALASRLPGAPGRAIEAHA